MTMSRVYTVSGLVTSPAGALDQRVVQLSLIPRDRNLQSMGGGYGGRVDPRTGAFVLQNVLPGSYYLSASAGAPNGTTLAARQAVEVSDRSLQVNVALQAPLELTGRIELDGESVPSLKGVMVQLIPSDPSSRMMGPHPAITVQEDGSFVAKNVGPGEWKILVFGQNAFLKSVQAGGRDLPGNVLDTSSGVPGPLRLVLSTKTATVRGTGTPGQVINLIEATSGSGDSVVFSRPYSALVTPSGEFTIGNLPPGRYRVTVGPLARPSSEETPQEVIVTEGGTATIAVRGTAR
jgi:hypothetical protein